jgi:hypothetical protein
MIGERDAHPCTPNPLKLVIPAKAGIQIDVINIVVPAKAGIGVVLGHPIFIFESPWIPAFAGMTRSGISNAMNPGGCGAMAVSLPDHLSLRAACIGAAATAHGP